MTKKFTCLLLAAIMMLSLAIPVAAEGGSVHLADSDSVFTEEQRGQILDALSIAADETGYSFAVVTTNNLGGKTPREYAEAELDSTFGSGEDSVLLLICNDFSSDGYDWVELSGEANDKYYNKINDIFDAFYAGLDSSGYYDAVINFCGYFTGAAPEVGGSVSVNLADHDDVLSGDEENTLWEVMQNTADDIGCNVGVVITDDTIGMGNEGYAQFFCENSFGVGANSIVLLFNNDKSYSSHRDWIYTYGIATDLYGNRTDGIFDYLYMGFDSEGGDNYYNGILYFCAYLVNNKDGGIYSDYNDYHDDDNYSYSSDAEGIVIVLFVPAVISGIITAVIVICVVNGYKKKAPVSAKSYMDAGRTKYTRRDDIYLRETTTHVRISSSGGGGGGGSRGGGGGRSRSGGGGGGGRSR